AGDVGEAGPEGEAAASGAAVAGHARARARGAVGAGVVGAAVAGEGGAVGVGLADDDREVTRLVVVVGAAGEGPVGRPAGDVGEAGPEVEAAARGAAVAGHARARARGAVGAGVVGAAVAGEGGAVGVGLADDDREVTRLVVVVGAAGEGPVGRPAGDVGEAG